MKEISCCIEINASQERVWEVLTDLRAFPRWNPLILAVNGELRKKERLEVRLRPALGPRITFQPVVLRIRPNRELRWQSCLLVSGLLAAEHTFAIDKIEANRVQFTQSETFTGVLAPLLSMLGLLRSARKGFDVMNRALKARAEGQPGG